MSGRQLQQRAHRRHAHLNRGLFDPPSDTSSSENSDDWLTWLFPPDHTETSSSSQTSSTTSPPVPPFLTTGVSDPFSTTATESLSTTSTTSSTSSTTTSSTSSVLPSSTSITLTTHVTLSAADAATSSTSTAAPTGGVSAGKIIGGVGAAIVGVAALFALIAFFLRRMRRRKDDDAHAFADSSSFRGSAVLIPDPPTHEDTIAAGYNPGNPPTMMERRPVTFGTMYNTPPPGFPPTVAYTQPPQYGYAPDPHMNPFMPQAAQAPFSPIEPAANPFNDSHAVTATTASPFTSPLSRQSSGRSNAQSVTDAGTIHAAEYVDLDRSSPSQVQVVRAQYVEIPSKQSTDTSAQGDSDTQPPPPPVPQKDITVAPTEEVEEPTPSPTTSKYGIPSTPPVLPEISLRDSGYRFPSSTLASTFPSGVTEVTYGQTVNLKAGSGNVPATPSPMASSFALTPKDADFKVSESTTVPSTTNAPQKRPETVYDLDDAYGGF